MKKNNRCPACQLWEMRRIPRKSSMRLLPGSRHYGCPVCGVRRLVWLGISITLPGRKPQAHSAYQGVHPLPAPFTAFRLIH